VSDLVVYGSATDPAEGASVASTGTLPAGRYRVTVTTVTTGTVAAGDLNNVQLQVGSTVVGTLLQVATAGSNFTNSPIEVNVPVGGAAISVTAVADASGDSAVYNAQIVVHTEAVF